MNKPNPSTAVPRIATMLFVDFVGSSEAASLKNQKEYGELIKSFQNTIKRVFKDEIKRGERNEIDKGIKYSEVRGDEGFLILVSKYGLKAGTPGTPEEQLWENRKNLLKALRIALTIKYEWLFAEENMTRFAESKKPFEVAIGINTGNVMIKYEENEWKAEGYAINLAKRIESQSRHGEYSGIFISEYSFGYYNDIPGENTLRFKQNEKVSLKGISGTVRTYELIFAMLDEEDEILNIPETILNATKRKLRKIEEEFNDTLNPWLGNVLCNIKWRIVQNLWETPQERRNIKTARKRLIEASSIARKLIEIDPNTPAWKIYLAQIIFDYATSYPEDYKKGNDEKELIYKLLVKNTVDFLKKLTESEPHELDARLYLGRFYLQVENINELLRERNDIKMNEKDEIQIYYQLALEEFQSIIIWQEKFPDAYYYLSASNLKVNPSIKTYPLQLLDTGIKFAGKINPTYSNRMKKDAREDSKNRGLFASVRKLPKFKEITTIS